MQNKFKFQLSSLNTENDMLNQKIDELSTMNEDLITKMNDKKQIEAKY